VDSRYSLSFSFTRNSFETHPSSEIFLFRFLQNYIQEIRRCTTKDAEEERVQKELGKIRKKYTSDKSMSGNKLSCLITQRRTSLEIYTNY